MRTCYVNLRTDALLLLVTLAPWTPFFEKCAFRMNENTTQAENEWMLRILDTLILSAQMLRQFTHRCITTTRHARTLDAFFEK